jgi:hypothetical protein
MQRLEPWGAVVAVLLAGVALAACKKKSEPPAEAPPSGGLAGSPTVGFAGPDAWTQDVVAPSLVVGLALLPDATTTRLRPAASPDASPSASASADRSAAEPGYGGQATTPATPDAGRTDARTETTRRPDAATDATTRLDARLDATPTRDAATPDDARARTDAAPDATPQVDATPRPLDIATPDTRTTPDAGTPNVDTAAVNRTFAGMQRNIQRCAEAEGPGQLHAHVRVRGTDGRVRDISIDSAYSDAAEQCAHNLIATLRFPTFTEESGTFDYTYSITDIPTTTDVGPGASLEEQMAAEESRLRRLAKRCTVGVTGPVTAYIWVSGDTRTATLRRVEGDVTAEQQDCLRGVLASANIPNIPTSTERSLRIQ